MEILEAFMLNKATGICFLMLMLIFTGCTNVKGSIHTQGETTSTKQPNQVESSKPNISEVQDYTSDCSKVLIPSNVERDTVLDTEKGLLTVRWYDGSKGKDVGFVFRYGDQNCSESAKQLVQHVLDSVKPPAGTPTKKYISQDVAIAIAKKTYQESSIKWETTMIENKETEINNQKKTVTVWDVTATYLAGNKMVVEIDAETGVIISETEIEAVK
jgi:hypothetical protein